MKVANKKENHPKGVAPDTKGVPGVFVDVVPDGLEFFEKKLRVSPYDGPLTRLAAESGRTLRFADARALVSIKVRAKKLGLRLAYAEAPSGLYVRYVGNVEGTPAGNGAARPATVEEKHETRRGHILGALKFGPASAAKLNTLLRAKGDETVDLPLTQIILARMVKAGEVVAREGGEFGLPAKKAE